MSACQRYGRSNFHVWHTRCNERCMSQPWTPAFFTRGTPAGNLASIEVYPKDQSAPRRRPPPVSQTPSPIGGQSGKKQPEVVIPREYAAPPLPDLSATGSELGPDWSRIMRRGGLTLAACGVLAALGYAAFSGPDKSTAAGTARSQPSAGQISAPFAPQGQSNQGYQALTQVGQLLADGLSSNLREKSAPAQPRATSSRPPIQAEPQAMTSRPQPLRIEIPEYRPGQAAQDLNLKPASSRDIRQSAASRGQATGQLRGRRLTCPNVPLLPDP